MQILRGDEWVDAFPIKDGKAKWKGIEFNIDEPHDCKLADKGFCDCVKSEYYE